MTKETANMLWLGYVTLCLIVFTILLLVTVIDSTSEKSEGYILAALVWILVGISRNEYHHKELRKKIDDMNNSQESQESYNNAQNG